MPLLTIHIVAIVGPDSGKHNSLPDCVVNCAPWHCPLLCPLLFLFCFLLSIISYCQSCVTRVQNFLYQDISSVIYFLCWHILSQSFIQPRKSLMARNDVNEYHYSYVCSSRPLYGIFAWQQEVCEITLYWWSPTIFFPYPPYWTKLNLTFIEQKPKLSEQSLPHQWRFTRDWNIINWQKR